MPLTTPMRRPRDKAVPPTDPCRSAVYRSVTPMIPPFLRRCPDCGKTGLARSFETVDTDGERLVECPRCGHRFEPVDRPTLN
jgi:DNA-directed RNA polymerase subunit RPC12/RpoP